MSKPHIPTSALLLGLAGLIPFYTPVAISLWSAAMDRSNAAEAMLFTLYAGLILSFLGGVRWGVEMVRNPDKVSGAALTLSILPSLIALAAGLLHWAGQAPLAWLLLGLGFFGQFHWDRVGARTGELPAWFRPLRLILTLGVSGAIAAMMVITVFLV